MAFIVDASAAAGWFLPDEETGFNTQLAYKMEEEDALVPDLFWPEVRNLFLKALRAGRINESAVLYSARPAFDASAAQCRSKRCPVRDAPRN